MNSGGSQAGVAGECRKCGEHTPNLLTLVCGHGLCPKCLTYVYHKFKKTMQQANTTHCPLCSMTCLLQAHDLNAINEFTNKVLIPLYNEDAQKNSTQSREGRLNMDSVNRGPHSYEHSAEKVTPQARGQRSKCESPKTFGKDCCGVHPDQDISVVCFTCNSALLCLSCLTGKRHNNHNIKTIEKGLQLLHEQLGLSHLKGKEFVDDLELVRKRLQDRQMVIQDRWERTKHILDLQFQNFIDLFRRKSEAIMDKYSQFYENLLEGTVADVTKVQKVIKLAQYRVQRVPEATNSLSTIQSIKKCTQLINQLNNRTEPTVDLSQIPFCDCQNVKRGVTELCEQVARLESGSARVVNAYKSEQKIKDTVKRVKTNMFSLNSSRDKRDKKCTKTEEDEKRFKSKANYKTESGAKLVKINKNIPGYLMQMAPRDPPFPECLTEFNPLQCSFKSSSKLLSKSHVPTYPEERKKKEHVAQIKQRLERKTFNGTTKEMRGTHDGMRKKKIH